MVVVAPGEPGTPVVCTCAFAEIAAAVMTTTKIPHKRVCLIDLMGVSFQNLIVVVIVCLICLTAIIAIIMITSSLI